MLGTEEAGEHAAQNQRNHETHQRVNHGHVFHDLLQVLQRLHGGQQLRHIGLVVNARTHAHQHGGAYRAKGHGSGLDDQHRHNRSHGWEAQGQQQGSAHGGGGTKARRAFNQRTKQPRHDDDLHAAVWRDVHEALANGQQCTAFFEGIEQQHGAENDKQQGDGRYHPVNGGGRDYRTGRLPHKQCQQRCDQVGRTHGEFGRPP